jgi:hypothetical protein
MTVGSLQGGVTLTMVPLVGLGSDQVTKSSNKINKIESYHLDEHRGIDGNLLRDCLLSLNRNEAYYIAILLYASPQSPQVGLFWFHCLSILASWDMLRLIVINEAHSVALDGWPEFHFVVKILKVLYDNQPTKCNCIAMFATFRQSD